MISQVLYNVPLLLLIFFYPIRFMMMTMWSVPHPHTQMPLANLTIVQSYFFFFFVTYTIYFLFLLLYKSFIKSLYVNVTHTHTPKIRKKYTIITNKHSTPKVLLKPKVDSLCPKKIHLTIYKFERTICRNFW